MLGLPGIPATAVTRPPPTAGPGLRNFIFSSGAFDAVGLSAAAEGFCASLVSVFVALLVAFAACAGFSCAVRSALVPITKREVAAISVKSLFIRGSPAG